MSLRPIRPHEIDALVQLCAEHARYERAVFTSDGQAERLSRALFSSPPRLFVWVVELDDRLAGFASASLEYSTWRGQGFLHLDCLYLRAEARGQGWGSKLLAVVVDYALQLGCAELQWQTPPWNEKAITFYDARGATSQPKLRFSLALDAPPERVAGLTVPTVDPSGGSTV